MQNKIFPRADTGMVRAHIPSVNATDKKTPSSENNPDTKAQRHNQNSTSFNSQSTSNKDDSKNSFSTTPIRLQAHDNPTITHNKKTRVLFEHWQLNTETIHSFFPNPLGPEFKKHKTNVCNNHY